MPQFWSHIFLKKLAGQNLYRVQPGYLARFPAVPAQRQGPIISRPNNLEPDRARCACQSPTRSNNFSQHDCLPSYACLRLDAAALGCIPKRLVVALVLIRIGNRKLGQRLIERRPLAQVTGDGDTVA